MGDRWGGHNAFIHDNPPAAGVCFRGRPGSRMDDIIWLAAATDSSGNAGQPLQSREAVALVFASSYPHIPVI